MHYFAYLIPVIAVAVVTAVRGEFDFGGILLQLSVMEAVVGFVHFLMHKAGQTNEYMGGVYVTVLHYYPWTERQTRTETVTLSNGQTKTVQKTVLVEHPDEYKVRLNTGEVWSLYSGDFYHFGRLWGTPRRSFETNQANKVSGGGGEAYDWDELECHAHIVTYTHRYTNPIRHSNSIFRYTEISKEEARQKLLYDYPKISHRVQPCVVAPFPISDEIQRAFTYINGYWGMDCQIHLFVLIYDATQPETSSVVTAEDQRAYWKGGNKNEFTLCLGVKGNPAEGLTIEWAHAFSWMDEPVMAVKLEAWLREQKTLDLMALNDWFRNNLGLWKRKEFKDFKYIHNPMRWWQLLILYTSVIIMVLAYAKMYWPKSERADDTSSSSYDNYYGGASDAEPTIEEDTIESTEEAEPARGCVMCSASGNCSVCEGTGHLESVGTCPTCEGSGKCTYCDGTGTEITQDERCMTCHGTGLCQICKGKGNFEGSPCACDGTGKCLTCGGKGKGYDN